jgi:hypothetical protein
MPGPLNVHGGTGELIVSNAGTVFANGETLPTGPGFATGCPFIKTGDDAGLYVNTGDADSAQFGIALSHMPVNVKGFGARGDGTTDDRDALDLANDATEEKHVPAGTYKVSSALTMSGVWRFDDGATIKPDSGVAITAGSTFVAFTGDVNWIDTSAGGTLTANAGSTQISVVAAGAGQSKNIVNGYAGNSIGSDVGTSVIAGGGNATNENTITGTTDTAYCTISGGYDNTIDTAVASTISGGAHHVIQTPATHGTVGGGGTNQITDGDSGTISGGNNNTISASTATIGGGIQHTISGASSTIAGGSTNTAASQFDSIGGGANNDIGASSNSATIGGGASNDITNGQSATIAGGNSNTITPGTVLFGDYSSIGGGLSNQIANTAQAQYATVAGGRLNTVNADYGAITGGRSNSVTGASGTAMGRQAVASLNGEFAQAAEAFSTAGDAQTSILIAKRQTTNATPTDLRLGSALQSISIPADTTWGFDILIVARRTDADGESAFYRLEGCIDNNAGTTALVGTVTTTVIAEDTAAWDVEAVADNTNDQLDINVTGEAGKTINWVARVTLVKVTG